ncbi:hypothetical protein MANI_006390 [Metarhizium anisopliae]
MLIAARAIQGVGVAGLNVLANICNGDLFSPRERGIYYGVIGGVWAVALSVGPVIGGAFTSSVSWHWCFYVNLPFCGIAFVIMLFFLNLQTPKTLLAEGIKAIDWIGVVLSLGSTLILFFGLNFGGASAPWGFATVICLIVFGFVGWGLFFTWEVMSLAPYPLLPVRIYKQMPNLYLPLFFQGALGATPILSGVYLLPTAVSLSVASIGTGVYMRKTASTLLPCTPGSSCKQ